MQILPQNERTRNRGQSDSDAVIIAESPLKRHERLRVSLELFNGVWLINSRKFEAENGEWRPSKQGIALGVKHCGASTHAKENAICLIFLDDH